MSAYEDAREKAWDAIAELLREWNEIGSDPMAEHPVIYDVGKIGRYVESPLFHAAVDTFLAALPPSIVVDGKVAELDRVFVHLWATSGYCPPECPLDGEAHAREDARRTADAAREVARGEQQ